MRTDHVAFVVAFLAVGIPYWLIPYSKVNLPDALVGPALVVVFAAAMFLRFFGIRTYWKSTWLMTGAVVAVVSVRILVGGIMDPTSHNLWPFEVVIAVFVGFAAAAPGALAGLVLMRLFNPSAAGPGR